MNTRNALRCAVAGTAFAAMLVPASSALAHPFGMCHVAGKSGTIVYFPPGTAANVHHRLLRRGVHGADYIASERDQLDFEKTGDRKCEDSKTPPGGTGR